MKPAKNSRGEAPEYLTHSQKYRLDLKGWLTIPNVLEDDLVKEIKEYCEDVKAGEFKRNMFDSDAILYLSEHPVIMGILNELVSAQNCASDDAYGYRLENSFCIYREKTNTSSFKPHGGSGYYAADNRGHRYSCTPAEEFYHNFCQEADFSGFQGRLNTGLTRIVFEFNPVAYGTGTRFISGSHKAALNKSDEVADHDSDIWDSYECDPGSLILFTEAITHSGSQWKSDFPRIAVFNCYNTIDKKFHLSGPTEEQYERMTTLQKSLFREVWNHSFQGDFGGYLGPNDRISDSGHFAV